MPFIRTGLCDADQVKCAKWLAADVDPKEAAKLLRTSVEVVKEFTPQKLEAAKKLKKKREIASVKHEAETRKTASALAGAAKTLLSKGPEAEISIE